MKKILLFTQILLTGVVFGQNNSKLNSVNDLMLVETKTNPKPTILEKNVVTLWSDNFSTPSNWTIDNSGQSGLDYGWNINSTSDGWFSANGISNGGSSNVYAELVNGDPTLTPGTQALDVVYTLTTANPIDISSLGGTNNVSLQFKQYGARFNDLQEIQISVDGINFVPVGNNLDKEVLSAAGGNPYPNPETKIINLAPFLNGLTANPTSVWIRFSWTTYFPQAATNPNVWVTYGWYIDDVKINTNPENDLSVASSFWGTAGLNYYQIPITQVAPIEFSAKVFNGGVNDFDGAFLKADVLTNGNNVFTGTSDQTAIVSLDSADLMVTDTYTPSNTTTGNYTLKRKVVLGYLPNGQILTGALTNGGFNYVSGSNIATTGGTGTGATVNITASVGGVVGTGNLSSAGTGYTTSSGVATTGGTGTGLTLDLTAAPIGVVTSLTVDLYVLGSVVSETNVPVTGGTGTGLIVDVVADANGDVDTIIIVNPGSGYQSTDYLTVTAASGPIDIIVNATNGSILTATVASAGTGYTAGDVVTISTGNTDASFTINTVSVSTITGAVLNSTGTGYTAGDVLTINGGVGATYTVATVTNNTEITDEITSNNTFADVNFSVTNYTYARDKGGNGTWPSGLGTSSNGGDPFEVGNLYDIWNDQTLYGITVRIAGGTSGTTVGTEIFVKLYEIDADGNFVLISQSDPFDVQSTNLNKLVSIPFPLPVDLIGGKTYLAVAGTYAGDLVVSDAGTSDEQTSFLYDELTDTWFFQTSTPAVRMNFDPSIVGLTEVKTTLDKFVLAPNPTNGSSSLTIETKNSGEALVSIADMSGKQISINDFSVVVGTNTINLPTEGLNSGVYFVNVEFQGATKAMKLIKR